MAEVSYSRMPATAANAMIQQQRSYSPAQARMAKAHPHLVWVRPRTTSLSKKLRLRVFDRDKGLCRYCGEQMTVSNFTVDHVVAVANGGSNDEANLCVSCRPCNSRKGARPWAL